MHASGDNTVNKNLKALIVEGGGMRGIFTAGVLDTVLRASFDTYY